MIVLVDAFNLIYKFPELEEAMARGELEAAMDGLLARLKKLKRAYEQGKPETKARAKSRQKPKSRQLVLHVFFDGKRKRGDETRRLKFEGMELYYSHDLSADHLIMEFIQRNPAPGDLLIVSTDKKVRECARIHRCQRQTSEEFAEFYESTVTETPPQDADETEIDPGVSADEVAYWQEMFRKKTGEKS